MNFLLSELVLVSHGMDSNDFSNFQIFGKLYINKDPGRFTLSSSFLTLKLRFSDTSDYYLK